MYCTAGTSEIALQIGLWILSTRVSCLMPSVSLQTYGAKVDQIKAPIGAAVGQPEIERALKSKKYKVLTFTHVDTSTGAFQHASITSPEQC